MGDSLEPIKGEIVNPIPSPRLDTTEILGIILWQHENEDEYRPRCLCWVCNAARSVGYVPIKVEQAPFIAYPVRVETGEIRYIPMRIPAGAPRCGVIPYNLQVEGIIPSCIEDLNHRGYHNAIVNNQQVQWL